MNRRAAGAALRAAPPDPDRIADLEPPDPLAGGRMTNRVAAARLLRETVEDEFLVEGWVEGPCAQVDAGVNIMGVGDAAAWLVGPQIHEPSFRDRNLVFGRVVQDIPAFCREPVAAFAEEKAAG